MICSQLLLLPIFWAALADWLKGSHSLLGIHLGPGRNNHTPIRGQIYTTRFCQHNYVNQGMSKKLQSLVSQPCQQNPVLEIAILTEECFFQHRSSCSGRWWYYADRNSTLRGSDSIATLKKLCSVDKALLSHSPAEQAIGTIATLFSPPAVPQAAGKGAVTQSAPSSHKKYSWDCKGSCEMQLKRRQ